MLSYKCLSKYYAALLAMMLAMLAVLPAHAQDEFTLGDMRIVYDSGYFDTDSLKGDLSNIRFYSGNSYIGSSDRLVIDYTLASGVFKLNTFLVEGLRFSDDDVNIYMESMSIENMIIDDQVLDQAFLESDAGVKVYNSGEIRINDIDIEAEGSRISLSELYVSDIPILPYQASTIPDYDSEIYIDRLTIALSPYDPSLAEYNMMLNMIGINDITVNMNSISSHRNIGDRYRQISNAEIQFVGLGTVETYGDIEYLKQTYHMFNENDFEDIDPSQALLVLSSFGGGIFINSIEMSYTDRGFMDYAFTLASQSSGMTRDDIADLAVMSIQGELMQFPDIADLIIPPIERFIRRGGRIVVSAEPTVSLPIISYLPLMESPSEAINVLGVRVTN